MVWVWRRVAFGWGRCNTCAGNPASVSSYSDPYGCWDCRNMGRQPYVRRWLAWSRRLSALAWKVGPV